MAELKVIGEAHEPISIAKMGRKVIYPTIAVVPNINSVVPITRNVKEREQMLPSDKIVEIENKNIPTNVPMTGRLII